MALAAASPARSRFWGVVVKDAGWRRRLAAVATGSMRGLWPHPVGGAGRHVLERATEHGSREVDVPTTIRHI